MIAVLDTNHLRELVSDRSVSGRRLRDQIEANGAEVFCAITVVEESMQGWQALLKHRAHGPEQVAVYGQMQKSLEASVNLGILPFDEDSAALFTGLRERFRRSGTMDLKLAAVCLAHDAMLLTRNVADFDRIPGLRLENWLD